MAYTDVTGKLLIVFIWLVFILSYVFTIATALAFLTTTWLGVLILLHLPINWVFHMELVKEMGSSEDVPELAS